MFGKYVCVRQQDETDCGPAVLATIALHYRMPVPVQKLRALAGTDRAGTNLLGLVRGAEQIGMTARAVKGSYEELTAAPLPAIAHCTTEEGFGHFVVLHRVRKDSVVVADPSKGVLTLSRDRFCRTWSGHLLLVAFEGAKPEGGLPPSPWRRFYSLLRPQAGLLWEAFFCAILVTVLGLSTSFFLQHLVDSVLVHGETRLLNGLAIGMVIVLVFRCLLSGVRQYLLIHLGRKVDLTLVSGYMRHVLRQPLKFFELRRVGEILSRVNDAIRIREALSGTTLTLLVDATLVVVSLAVMFCYDWRLALVAAGFIPVFLIGIGLHHPSTKRLSREMMERAAGLQAHVVEDISAIDTIKAFRAESRRTEEGERHLVRTLKSVFDIQKLGLRMSGVGMFLTAAAGIAVLWYGGHRVIQGGLTIGALMSFYGLLGMLLGPLERLATVNLEVQDAIVALDRLGEVLDLETEPLEGDSKAEVRGVREALRLEGVRFRYGCRAEVLRGLDLTIPAGKVTAIVGESGGGKSTLLKLLQRFYEPTEGRITLDGMDLRDFGLASLRSRIGVVSQDPYVFNGSVRENLSLAKPEATMEEIVDAARASQLEEFIETLPQRYDALIGERGANLSGGQRQRLAIARALLARPEILIFDEATSHLDSVTEEAIRKNLRERLVGKTVILVAHRLSTVRDADRIHVLEQGRILESGSHEDLIETKGKYASLWETQTGSPTNLYVFPLSDREMDSVAV